MSTRPFPLHPARVFPILAAIILACSFWITPAFSDTPVPPVPLTTVSTLAEAFSRAKKDGRLVYLQFKASGCPHCQAFQENVMDLTSFRRFARKRMQLVIYDIARDDLLTPEQAKEMEALMTEHSVRYTPTILIFSPDGVQLLKIEGYRGATAEEFISQLKALLQPHPGRVSGPDRGTDQKTIDGPMKSE